MHATRCPSWRSPLRRGADSLFPRHAWAEFSINFVPFPAEPVAWGGDLRMEQLWGLFGDRPLATSRVTLFIRQQGSRIGGTLIYDRSSIDPSWRRLFRAGWTL
jgi:hypothetical protein